MMKYTHLAPSPRITKDQHDGLERLKKKMDRSGSWLVREAISRMLGQEDTQVTTEEDTDDS